jgi:hypothetical protein
LAEKAKGVLPLVKASGREPVVVISGSGNEVQLA